MRPCPVVLLLAVVGCHQGPPSASSPTPPMASSASRAEDPHCIELAQALIVLDTSPEAKTALEVLRAGNPPIDEQCAVFLERHAQRPRCTPDEPRCAGLVPGAGTAEESGAAAATELWLHEGCAR